MRTDQSKMATALIVLIGTAHLAACSPSTSTKANAPDGPQFVRGQITAVTPGELTIKLASGADDRIVPPADSGLLAVTTTKMEGIRPGSYVGAAAAPDGHGDLKAIEVHIFDERLRGLGEGSSILDPARQNTMTNGTVGNVVGTAGRTITVRYGNEQKQINVPDDIPVTLVAPGDRTLLAPGNRVVAIGKRQNGKLVALQLLVGRDGFKPPL
jgi:hypothetical protein